MQISYHSGVIVVKRAVDRGYSTGCRSQCQRWKVTTSDLLTKATSGRSVSQTTQSERLCLLDQIVTQCQALATSSHSQVYSRLSFPLPYDLIPPVSSTTDLSKQITVVKLFMHFKTPNQPCQSNSINSSSFFYGDTGADPKVALGALPLFPYLPFFLSLSFFFPSHPTSCPSLPYCPSHLSPSPTLSLLSLPLEVGPLNTAKSLGPGSAVSFPVGSGAPADMEWCILALKSLTSGSNNFSNFSENQLTKFRAF